MISRTRYPNLAIALFVVIILVVFSWILHMMGQPPWCVCGLKFMTLDAWGSESSQNFIDPYTTSHVLHGILFFAILSVALPRLAMQKKLLISFFLEIGWELLENTPLIINRYRDATASLGYTGDTILNSVSDVLFMLFGFWIAARLPWKWTLAILVLTELLMLLVYRDNLTLNILMLVTPIDAVREWQIAR
jgi:hypothetical protein